MKTVKQIKEDKDPMTIWKAVEQRNSENRMVRRFIEEQNKNRINFEIYLQQLEGRLI